MKKLFFLVAVFAVILNSCAQPEPQKITLNVFAAASLINAFDAIGALFEAQHPGTDVVFNFAGSQQLAQQINAGAPADVFASANRRQIDAVVEATKIKPVNVQSFLTNELVVIVPTDNPAQIKALNDLIRHNIKVILAAAEVPAGQYAIQMLDNAGIKDGVLANVVSYEDSVRSVLTKIALGEADAGLVYSSDAYIHQNILSISIPPEFNVTAEYFIAPVLDSAQIDLAQAFIELVLSNDGQSLLQQYGFTTK